MLGRKNEKPYAPINLVCSENRCSFLIVTQVIKLESYCRESPLNSLQLSRLKEVSLTWEREGGGCLCAL